MIIRSTIAFKCELNGIGHFSKCSLTTIESTTTKEANIMLLKDFLTKTDDLELPFMPKDRIKYPVPVWKALHEEVVRVLFQTTDKYEAIALFIDNIKKGNDIGGFRMDNLIHSFLMTTFAQTEHIVQSAFRMDKLSELFGELMTEEEVVCTEWHSEEEKKLQIEEGIIPDEHNHTLIHIKVDEDNKDRYDELVLRVMQDFDSANFGELPEEYTESKGGGMPSFDEFMASMKDMGAVRGDDGELHLGEIVDADEGTDEVEKPDDTDGVDDEQDFEVLGS